MALRLLVSTACLKLVARIPSLSASLSDADNSFLVLDLRVRVTKSSEFSSDLSPVGRRFLFTFDFLGLSMDRSCFSDLRFPKRLLGPACAVSLTLSSFADEIGVREEMKTHDRLI